MKRILSFVLCISIVFSHASYAHAENEKLDCRDTFTPQENNEPNDPAADLTPSPSKQKSLLTWVDEKVTRTEPWQFDLATEAQLLAILYDESVSPERRFLNYYHALVAARQQLSHPVSRWLAKRMVASATKNNSIYNKTLGRLMYPAVGPHYNFFFNRTHVQIKKPEQLTPLEAFIAFHEVNHGIHRNENPVSFIASGIAFAKEFLNLFIKTPTRPLTVRHMESVALGSQWEMVHRIPASIRDRMITEIDSEIQTPAQFIPGVTKLALVYSHPYTVGTIARLLGKAIDESNTPESMTPQAYAHQVFNSYTHVGERLSLKQTLSFIKKTRSRLNSKEYFFLKSLLLGSVTLTFLGNKTIERLGLEKLPELSVDDFINGHDVYFDDNSPAIKYDFTLTQKTFEDGFWNEFRKTEQYKNSIRLVKLFNVSLNYAHLNKPEFINVVSEHHGYTLKNLLGHHYGLRSSFSQMLFLLSTVVIIGSLLQFLSDGTLDESSLENIPAKDIRWIAKFLASQLIDDPTPTLSPESH